MLELRGVTVRYGERRVLDDITATIGPEPTAVMGPSGSGKTTLLRVLSGQQKSDTGEVLLDGEVIRASRWGAVSDDGVAFVHQDYQLVDFLSVVDNVLLASELRGLDRSEADARETLAKVGLDGSLHARKPGALSGGEQQRVAIARALLCGARVLLADEPTGALDAVTTRQITDLLLATAEAEDIQIVVVTHDPAVASRMPRRLLLDEGRLRPLPGGGGSASVDGQLDSVGGE